MLTLYQFKPIWGLPNLSPFCIKVEAYLRMTGLEHRTQIADPRKAPKGKLPYLRDGDTIVSDSTLILDYLKQKYGDTLDGHLSAEQKAVGRAFQWLFEEHLYWVGIHLRWRREEGWAYTQDYFDMFKGLQRHIILPLIRRKMLRALHAQGLGRHTHEEIMQIAEADFAAVSDYLGEKEFFFGTKPSSYDAVAYAFLISLLWAPIPSKLKDEGLKRTNLSSYCERFKKHYWKS